ncbi:type II toxin-antitoxin system VapC family toxin [sulfur-oxidizing endosymbiont of Gigantopelta aegis]|uniref:type II toxin-antitoxin system VapC family toxin n=1 Tax=sulfur-oxidizing endosymbiont of Gigantopelta aegis TaxID=2794934 RepID=UPI0018DBEC29|nr:type II toxin-antitoxin system VapC family toxin [sulfur-oxidizing endosymbiont of Gigantopelta aegis]
MILVDTCGWIEWLTDGILANKYQVYMQDVESIIVPTSVQFELYKWASRVKNKQEALKAIALTEQGKVIPLTTSISLLAGDFSSEYKLSFADAIIYATAQNEHVELITSDEHFLNLPEVVYFKK